MTPTVTTPTPTAIPENDLITPEGYPRVGIWLLVLLAIWRRGAGVLGSQQDRFSALGTALGTVYLPGWAVGVQLSCTRFPRRGEWIASGAARLEFCF